MACSLDALHRCMAIGGLNRQSAEPGEKGYQAAGGITQPSSLTAAGIETLTIEPQG